MSTDYGEKEREFLEALKTDTGRSLEEWMAAIGAAGLTHRNVIIDWLRRQGFMFSKASWLERIHNNSGQPIYAGAGAPRARAVPRATTPRIKRPALSVVPDAAAAPPPPAPPPPAAPAAIADPAALDTLLATAKAFRPLAAYVLTEVRKAVPEVEVAPGSGLVTLARGGAVFAILAISAKELRLGISAKDSPPPPFEAAKFGPNLRIPPAVTHMAVLTDARQITPQLIAAVKVASA